MVFAIFDYLHYCALLFSVPFLLSHDSSSMKIEIEIESGRPTPCSVPLLVISVASRLFCVAQVQVIAEDGTSEKAGKGGKVAMF